MLKEIFEQPKVVQRTLEGHNGSDHVLITSVLSHRAIWQKCATYKSLFTLSYHASMVARYWLEELQRDSLPGQSIAGPA
jgi:glucosamine--fructose-6-phosphate aminotransferase (isomerizing)